LAGRYVESGDSGRNVVAAGDVLIHAAHEAHIDRVDPCGAQVFVLPVPAGWRNGVLGRVADPDAIVRLAEKDQCAATDLLTTQFEVRLASGQDWPAMLADAIVAQPRLDLREWALAHDLHPGSLSRGFRSEFGITPARFRVLARMHRALRLIETAAVSLADVALSADFADQPHLNRVIRRELETVPTSLIPARSCSAG
jgi:AraC-like DNA-binding protein